MVKLCIGLLFLGASLASFRVRAQDLAPRILIVSPEQTGVLQTGGLAHATAGLTASLNAEGIPTTVLMPFFLEMQTAAILPTGENINVGLDWRDGQSHKTGSFSVLSGGVASNPTVFLRHETAQKNYFDNRTNGKGAKFYSPDFFIGEAFGAFAKAAAEYILTHQYDVVILNDWTTGLIAVHLDEARKAGVKVPKVVFAIHNIAYQGEFPRSLADFLGLDPRHFNAETGYESWGKLNFLKAGLQYADLIYTVSKQYAKDIATTRFGAGLEGVIQHKQAQGKFTGILNGILDHEWDPRLTKAGLEHQFSSEDLAGKERGKKELQKSMGLPVDAGIPLFILTSRLAEQKGFEYLTEAMADITRRFEVQWIIIGNGDAKYIEQVKALQDRFPQQTQYRPFTSALEAMLTRYGDFFVNGAWFEPSGLNQFFALKNGTIPVVSAAGGLAESVRHNNNGIVFPIIPGANGTGYDVGATRQSAITAFESALDLYRHPEAFLQMRRRGMAENNSWTGRIRRDFAKLFKVLGGGKGFGTPRSCLGAHAPAL